jgi:hypothetical protein
MIRCQYYTESRKIPQKKDSPGQVGDPPTGTGTKKPLWFDWQFANRWDY